jgi:putative glutamine amidotransferase
MDGLLFTGGGDINPAIFNGDPNQHVYHIDQERDSLEIFLVRQAAEKGFPFFGICRGIQVINVALGGKLYTDIHDQLPGALRHDNHNKLARDETAHLVAINPKTRLESLVGTGDLPVNSFHHQGIESLGASLQATAYAPDGLIEAVEIPGHPFGLGVQWHPEWMTRQKLMLELFRGFVRAAGNG